MFSNSKALAIFQDARSFWELKQNSFVIRNENKTLCHSPSIQYTLADSHSQSPLSRLMIVFPQRASSTDVTYG